MTHGQVAAQTVQRRFVEDLGHQSHVLVDHDMGPVADGHPGRFLPPMLERVETEIGQLRHRFARRPHPEDTTRVLRTLVVAREIVIQQSVSAHRFSVGVVTERTEQ